MENFYIRIVDGLPFDHPVAEHNMLTAFPSVDLNNLPEGWARFEKTDPPRVGAYAILEPVEYQWVGAVVKEIWRLTPLPAEQRAAKEAELRNKIEAEIQVQLDLTQAVLAVPRLSEKNRIVMQNHLELLQNFVIADPSKATVPAFPDKVDGNYVPFDLPVTTL